MVHTVHRWFHLGITLNYVDDLQCVLQMAMPQLLLVSCSLEYEMMTPHQAKLHLVQTFLSH